VKTWNGLRAVGFCQCLSGSGSKGYSPASVFPPQQTPHGGEGGVRILRSASGLPPGHLSGPENMRSAPASTRSAPAKIPMAAEADCQ
jgi:hypothetical protein